jgi:O-antigen/teichoic acid export membrane protein
LARKSLLLFTVNMAKSLLGFLSTMLIARWMGAEALGTIGYLLGLLGMLAVLLDMGFSFAHLKHVSQSAEDPAPLVGAFLALKGVLAVVFAAAALAIPLIRACLGRPLFHSADEPYVYAVVAAFYVLHSLSGVPLFTFEARLESAKQSAAAFIGSFLAFTAKAITALLGLGVVALSFAYLVEPLTLLISALLLFGGYRLARPRREHVTSYIRYALPLTLNTAITMAISNVNPVILRAFWPNTEVGYYTSVLGFGVLLERLTSTVAVLFLPQASSDASQGNVSEIRRRLYVIERHVLTALVPLGVILIVFSHELVVIAFGAEFVPAAPILMGLVANSVLVATFSAYGLVLYAVEKQRYLVFSNAVGLLTLLLVNAVLVPHRIGRLSLPGLGGTGSAIALVMMTLAGGVVQVWAVKRSAGIDFYWKASIYLVAGGVMYSLMHTGRLMMALTPWVEAVLLTAGGLGIFIGILSLFGQFTRADAQVFLSMLHPQKMLEYVSGELGRRQ